MAYSSADSQVAEGNSAANDLPGVTVVSLPVSAGRYTIGYYVHSAGALGSLRFNTGEAAGALAFNVEWGGANAFAVNPIPLVHTFSSASVITMKIVNSFASRYFAGIFVTPY